MGWVIVSSHFFLPGCLVFCPPQNQKTSRFQYRLGNGKQSEEPKSNCLICYGLPDWICQQLSPQIVFLQVVPSVSFPFLWQSSFEYQLTSPHRNTLKRKPPKIHWKPWITISNLEVILGRWPTWRLYSPFAANLIASENRRYLTYQIPAILCAGSGDRWKNGGYVGGMGEHEPLKVDHYTE